MELAKLVNTLKTVSSRLIRKKHSEYLKEYYWKPVFWSRSYCILTTGGATILRNIFALKQELKIKNRSDSSPS
nr:transposase [Vallitalea longa]